VGWNFELTTRRVHASPNPLKNRAGMGRNELVRWVTIIKKNLSFSLSLFVSHNKFFYFLLHIMEKKEIIQYITFVS